MPDTPPTEELCSILKRWHTFRRKRTWFFTLSGVLAFLYFASNRNPSPYFLAGYITIWLAGVVVDRYAKQEFAKQMTRYEFEILQQGRYTVESHYYRGTIIELTKIYRHTSPKEELLRASQSTESGDTLLRAATYTDAIPQEQLLRPTSPDNQ